MAVSGRPQTKVAVFVGMEGIRGSHYVFTEFRLLARSDDENCQVCSLAWNKCPYVAMHTRQAFDC